MAAANEAMHANEVNCNDPDGDVTYELPDISCLETFARCQEAGWNTMSVDDAWAELSAWSGPAAGPISGLSSAIACCVDSFKNKAIAPTLKRLKVVLTYCAAHNEQLGNSKVTGSSAWHLKEQCNLLTSAFLSSQFLLQSKQGDPVPNNGSSGVHQAAVSCLAVAGSAARNALITIQDPHLHVSLCEVVSKVLINQLFLPAGNVGKPKPAGTKHAAEKAGHVEQSSAQVISTHQLTGLAASLFLPSVAGDKSHAVGPAANTAATNAAYVQHQEWAAFERLAYDILNAACMLGTSGPSNATHIATAQEFLTSLLVSLCEHDAQLCSRLALGLGQILHTSTGAWQPYLQHRLSPSSTTATTNSCIMDVLLQILTSTVHKLLEHNLAGLLLSCVSQHMSSAKAATRKLVLTVAAVAIPSADWMLARNAASLLAQGCGDQDATVRLKAINSCISSLPQAWEQELDRHGTDRHQDEAHDVFITYILPCTCHRLLDTAKTVRVKAMQLLSDILKLPTTSGSNSHCSKSNASSVHIKKEAARLAFIPLCRLMDARQDSTLWDESKEKAVQDLMSKVIHTLGRQEMLTHVLNTMMPTMNVHFSQDHTVGIQEATVNITSKLQPHTFSESLTRSLVHQCQPTDTSAAISVWLEYLKGLNEPHHVEYIADICKGVPNQSTLRRSSIQFICQTLSSITAAAATEPGVCASQCNSLLESLHAALKVLFCFSTQSAQDTQPPSSNVLSSPSAGGHYPDDSICEAAVLLDAAWALISIRPTDGNSPEEQPAADQEANACTPQKIHMEGELDVLHSQQPAFNNEGPATEQHAAGGDTTDACQLQDPGVTARDADRRTGSIAQECLVWCFYTLLRNMPPLTSAVRQTNSTNHLLLGQLVSRSVGRMLAGPLAAYPLRIQDAAFKLLCSCPGAAQATHRLLRTLQHDLCHINFHKRSSSQQQGLLPACETAADNDKGVLCTHKASMLPFGRYLTLLGHMTKLYEADRADFIARAMNTTNDQGAAALHIKRKQEGSSCVNNELRHNEQHQNGNVIADAVPSDYMAGEETKQAVQEAAQKYLQETMQRSAPGTHVPLLVAVLQEHAGQDQHMQFLQVLALRALWRLMHLSLKLAEEHQKLLCCYVLSHLRSDCSANSAFSREPHRSTGPDSRLANNQRWLPGDVALMAEALQGAKALLIDNPNASAALLAAIEELIAGLLQSYGTNNNNGPDEPTQQPNRLQGLQPAYVPNRTVLLQAMAVYVEVLCSDKLQMKGCTWRLLGQCALCQDDKVQALVIAALKHILALPTISTQGTARKAATATRSRAAGSAGAAPAAAASLVSRQVQVLLALYSNCEESQRPHLVEEVLLGHGLLTEQELTADGLVISVLQSLGLAETPSGRGAALAMLAHMTPSSKALAALSSMLQSSGLSLARMPQANAQTMLKTLIAFVSRHKSSGITESGKALQPATTHQQGLTGEAISDTGHTTSTIVQQAVVQAPTSSSASAASKSVAAAKLLTQLQALADNLKSGNVAARPPLPRPPTASASKQQASQPIAARRQAPSITIKKEPSTSDMPSIRSLRPRTNSASKRKRVVVLTSSSSGSE